MPAAEAMSGDERELVSYELAFHVLPTVAEGEVMTVLDTLKNHIKKAGGELGEEEAPQRFDLAYDIEKYLEGKNRKFGSTYFGWVRFKLESSKLNGLTENIDGTKELLRYLLVKLTKVEEQNPFMFHESIADSRVQTIEEDDDADTAEEESEEIEDKDESEEVKNDDSGEDTKETV